MTDRAELVERLEKARAEVHICAWRGSHEEDPGETYLRSLADELAAAETHRDEAERVLREWDARAAHSAVTEHREAMGALQRDAQQPARPNDPAPWRSDPPDPSRHPVIEVLHRGYKRGDMLEWDAHLTAYYDEGGGKYSLSQVLENFEVWKPVEAAGEPVDAPRCDCGAPPGDCHGHDGPSVDKEPERVYPEPGSWAWAMEELDARNVVRSRDYPPMLINGVGNLVWESTGFPVRITSSLMGCSSWRLVPQPDENGWYTSDVPLPEPGDEWIELRYEYKGEPVFVAVRRDNVHLGASPGPTHWRRLEGPK